MEKSINNEGSASVAVGEPVIASRKRQAPGVRHLPLLLAAAVVTLSPALARAQRFEPVAEPELRSPRMMSAGITLTSGGIVTSSIGALVYLSIPSTGEHFTGLLVGIPAMVFGASLLVTGIPLWVIGALDAPGDRAGGEAHPGEHPALRPELMVGFDRVAVRWAF